MFENTRNEWRFTKVGMDSVKFRGRPVYFFRWRVRWFLYQMKDLVIPAFIGRNTCKIIGHKEQRKMYDTICERCRIVLRSR